MHDHIMLATFDRAGKLTLSPCKYDAHPEARACCGRSLAEQPAHAFALAHAHAPMIMFILMRSTLLPALETRQRIPKCSGQNRPSVAIDVSSAQPYPMHPTICRADRAQQSATCSQVPHWLMSTFRKV